MTISDLVSVVTAPTSHDVTILQVLELGACTVESVFLLVLVIMVFVTVLLASVTVAVLCTRTTFVSLIVPIVSITLDTGRAVDLIVTVVVKSVSAVFSTFEVTVCNTFEVAVCKALAVTVTVEIGTTLVVCKLVST